jgi:hypothetical protein
MDTAAFWRASALDGLSAAAAERLPAVTSKKAVTSVARGVRNMRSDLAGCDV